MAVQDNTTATYRYFVVNLVTNQAIAEIPFKGVSYERALKGAGAFSGTISVSDETAHLQLYESTMPGRTALYVVRDDVCVWGGIIWSRSYNVNDRVLSVSASEFTSYFYHRRIWKTWGQVFEATLVAQDGIVTVTLEDGSTYELQENSTVRYSFLDIANSKYDGYYTILPKGLDPVSGRTLDITSDQFYTRNTASTGEAVYAIPNGTYINTTVYARTNTYDFVKVLIEAMGDDFAGIDFPNTEIRPFNFVTTNVLVRSVSDGVASLIVDENVNLVPGQEIQIKNVSPVIDGLQKVSAVNGNVITINASGTLGESSVDANLYRITEFKVDTIAPDESIVEVKTDIPHELYAGAYVAIEGLDTPDSTSTLLDGEFQVANNPTNNTTFQYSIPTPLTRLPLTLSAPKATVSSKPVQFLTRKEVRSEGSQRVGIITTGQENNFVAGDPIVITDMKDYATVTKRAMSSGRITFTTRSTHNFLVGRTLTVTGLADTATVTQRAMSFSGSNATFTITTSVPHNLVTGNVVTVSGLSDSYQIGRYQYTQSTNTAVFFTGSGSTSVNHNIQSTNVAGSIEIKNLPSVSATVNRLSSSGRLVTLTTTSAHGFPANTNVIVSGVSSSQSFTITRLERVNNVTTVTTSTAHGLSEGDFVSISGGGGIPLSFDSSTNIFSVTSNTFKYDNPSGTASSSGSDQAILNCAASFTWEFQSQGRGRQTVSSGTEFGALDTMYQGNPSTTFGCEAGAARFQTLSSQLPSGVALADITSIDSLRLTMTRRAGVGYSNATLYLGIHGESDITEPDPPPHISGATAPNWTGWSTGTVTRTLQLPTDWRALFQSGTARGIIVGQETPTRLWAPTSGSTASTPGDYMGVYGEGAGTREPYITVDYTYQTGEPGLFTGSDIGTVTKSLSGYNGTFTISSTTSNTITYSAPNAADTNGTRTVNGSANGASSPLNKVYTGADIISKTANSITVRATGIGRDFSLNTLPTSTTASIIESNGIFNVQNAVATVVSSTQFTYPKTNVTYNVAVASQTAPTGGLATIYSADFNVTNCNIFSVTANTVTVNTTSSRTVAEADANPTGTAASDSPLVGTFTVRATPTADTVTFNVTNLVQTFDSQPIYGYSSALQEATVSYGTYGPYTSSANLDFEVESDKTFSDTNVFPLFFRGFEVRNIGEELDKYSDIVDGFDYRVDCTIDPNTGSFRRQFVLIPVFPTEVKNYIASLEGGVLPAGQTVPLSYYGADRLVFEFPGNINDVQLEESAENSATRFFMVGNIGDLGDDISQPYAVATDTSLLSPDVGNYPWPLLDEDEATEDFFDGETLYSYAERYLLENKPPDGKFAISVNGSVEPIVGTYAPGDWCALIINDDFISQRLSSDLEPRETVLLRKINSYSVEVPDSVTFPERITLQLIAEWQVDKRGE